MTRSERRALQAIKILSVGKDKSSKQGMEGVLSIERVIVANNSLKNPVSDTANINPELTSQYHSQ
jgi:hypothetical protein